MSSYCVPITASCCRDLQDRAYRGLSFPLMVNRSKACIFGEIRMNRMTESSSPNCEGTVESILFAFPYPEIILYALLVCSTRTPVEKAFSSKTFTADDVT